MVWPRVSASLGGERRQLVAAAQPKEEGDICIRKGRQEECWSQTEAFTGKER